MKGKHSWVMLICCLVPILGLGVAWLLGVPLGTLGTVALLLLCPLGHFLMMRGGGHTASHSPTPSGQTNSKDVKET